MQPSAIQSLPCLLTVGVTEKPRWKSNGAFCLHLRIIDYLCDNHSIDNHNETDPLGRHCTILHRPASRCSTSTSPAR